LNTIKGELKLANCQKKRRYNRVPQAERLPIATPVPP